MIKTLSKKSKGSVLVFAIIILSMITVTALGLAHVTQMEINTSLDTKNSGIAFQKAEIGMEEILFEILKNSNDLDTLSIVATKLPSASCVSGVISVPDKGIEFSFMKMVVNGSTEAKEPVISCGEVLADVAAIKTVGEHTGTARGFYQNLKSSLSRDLVAHWKFEDNVDALLEFIKFPGSPIAKDSSDNEYVLTLCPIDNGDHKLADGGGAGDESFDSCHQYYSGNVPSPDAAILGDVNDDDNLDDSVWMDHGGGFDNDVDGMHDYYGTSWGVQGHKLGYIETSGVVHEYKKNPLEGVLSSIKGQGLYFNGRSNYLTMNTSESSRTNYVKNEADLEFLDKLSVSFWVKFEGDLTDAIDAIILTKYQDSGIKKGYKIYIKDSDPNAEVCFNFSGSEKCGGNVSDGKWHHVVITWDNNISNNVDVYIDNTYSFSHPRNNNMKVASEKFMVGGNYTKSNKDEPYLPIPHVFPHADIEEPFEGYLDDIRLYNRKLSTIEINRLCIMGDSTEHPAGC